MTATNTDVQSPGAFAFYWAIDCPRCECTTHQGINLTTMTYKGLPAILLDMGTGTSYDCECCGAVICVDELDPWAVDADGA